MQRTFAFVAASLVLLSLPASTSNLSNSRILALLPADTAVYVGIEDFRHAYDAAKEFVQRVAPKGKLFDELEKTVLEQIDAMPEQLKRSTRDGLKKLVSAHLAFTNDARGDLSPILLVRVDDDKLLEKLVYDDMKVWSTETLNVSGRKVLQIEGKGLGRTPWIYVAAIKDIGVAATDLDLLKDIFARADGGTASKPGLKGTPLFDRLSTAGAAKVGLKIYFDLGRLIDNAMHPSYYGGRYGRYHSDLQDAIFGFSSMKNAWLEASLEKGRITSRFEMQIGKNCSLYHLVWKQKAGSQDTLKYVPAEAAAAAQVNIESGEALLKQLEEMFKRAEEAYSAERRRYRSKWDEFCREFREALGLAIEDAARVIDTEAACFYAPSDWESTFKDGNGLCFIGKMKNPEAVKEAVKKVAGSRLFRRFEWEETRHKGVTIAHAKHIPGDDFHPAYAIDGNFLIIGSGEKTIQKALDARDGDNVARRATSRGSKTLYVNFKNCWKMLHVLSRGEFPDWHKDMADDITDLAVITETDDRLVYTAQDCLGVSAWIAALSVRLLAQARPVPIQPAQPVSSPEQPQEAIPKVDLPKDAKEAERFIQDLIDNLAADDVSVRNDATRKLKGIGDAVVKPLVKAAQETGDPEVKSRAEEVLLYLKAYEAFPGLLEKKVDTLIAEIKKVYEGERLTWYSFWRPNEPGIWNIEPGTYKWEDVTMALRGLDYEVLDSAAGMRKFAEAMTSKALRSLTRQAIGLLITRRRNTSACSEELRRAFESGELEIKCYALIAMGRCPDDTSRDLVLKHLESDQLGLRRAAFLAAERSSDPRVYPVLLKLLEAEDLETRFNAAYTLEQLARGAVRFNMMLPREERAAAIKAARDWYESNKEKLKPHK